MNLHHIGVATNDIMTGIRHHEDFFNIHPVTEIVEDPIQKVLVVLLSAPSVGGPQIELIQPVSDDSPVSNMLKRGTSLYHLCFEVEDIEAALLEARTRGALVISGPAPAELFKGRKIAFIYGPDHYVVEFLEVQRSPLTS
jgi:methylmalonyl-CoA/ethylmalonyl-CoA epimerase